MLADELTLGGVVAGAAAGAVFAALLGVFGVILLRHSILTFLFCGVAGSVAGAVWASIRAVSMGSGLLVGGMLGIAVAVFELRVFSSSNGAA